jgi:hypothetical protein
MSGEMGEWLKPPDCKSGLFCTQVRILLSPPQTYEGVAQLVERKVWLIYQIREAVGSIPTTLTTISRCETKKEDWQSG